MKMLFFTIIILQGLSSMTLSVTLVGDPLAIQGQDYKLSCLKTNISSSAEMDWYTDGVKYDAVLCSPLVGFCEPPQSGRYTFNIDKNGMYINITGLKRTEDQRQWKCTYKVQGSPLEEATMNLTIFTIPSGLIYNHKPSSSADLSLSAVMLECVTSGCIYPVPVIKWYYKDASPPGLATLYKTTVTHTAGGNCTSPEMVSSSILELPQNTTWSDNSDKTVKFSCGIEYPKPFGTVFSPDSLTITFAIRVSWIQMRQNSTAVSDTILTVTSGESVTLTCVTGTSRPDPTIEWFIENQSKGNKGNLTFFPADTDHDKMIYCRAYNTNPNITVESAKPRMFVKVRVIDLTLQQNGHAILDDIVTVTSEQAATLTCVTGTSRPPAIIEWYIGSQKMGNGTNFTFNPTNVNHHLEIFCHAYNTDPSRPAISLKPRLFVKVKVSNVTLWDSSSGTIVFNEGYPKTLKCISSPSRPVSSIRWWFESQSGTTPLTNNVTNAEMPDADGLHIRISEITLTLMKDSRNKRIFCNGNIDGQQISAVSSKVNVDVWFQPQKPVVKEFSASFPWLENRTETLHCYSSDNGNPNSSIKWSSEGGIEDTIGHLVIPELVPDDNGKMVFCELVNNYTLETNTRIVSEPVSLNVEYSPSIHINSTDSLSVNETQSVSVLCTANGNPSPNQTVWIGQSADNVLRFVNISRTATSNYTCEATSTSLTHGKLKSQRQLTIIVQYSPQVIVESSNGSYNEKGLMIKCSAHGVPERYTFRLTHISLHSGIKIRQLSFEYVSTGIRIYQFSSPTYMDTGIYTCTVSNGVPAFGEGSVDKSENGTVWIRDIPRVTSIDRSFYAENGHSGRLVIELFSSLLHPQVTWYKHSSGTLDKLQDSEKYNIMLSSTHVSMDFYSVTILQPGYIATLEIKNVTKDDFGSYQVHVQNSVGEMSPLILILKATANEQQYTSSNEPDGALLGGVLGSAVLVSMVVAAVGVILYRRRNKYLDRQSGKESTSNRENKVTQNSKREEEHYQELEIIEDQVDEKNQSRSAGSPVYETLTTDDNIREHQYSHLKNASCSDVVKELDDNTHLSKTRSVE